MGNQLGSDPTITGVNEEDSTINVVSDGETANNHLVSSHNDVLTLSSPKKKKLRGDRVTAEESIQEGTLTDISNITKYIKPEEYIPISWTSHCLKFIKVINLGN